MGYRLSHKSDKTLLFRTLGVIVLLFLFTTTSYGQARENNDRPSPQKVKKDNSFDLENVIIGGSFGAQFGSITIVDLSPTAGYLFKEKLLVGLGARYIYFEEKFVGFTFRSNIYGGSVFSQYYFLENFIAHAEQEILSIENFNNPDTRTTISSTFLGGGYRSFIGRSSFISFLFLYNLNETPSSPYRNPVIRINFGIGL